MAAQRMMFRRAAMLLLLMAGSLAHGQDLPNLYPVDVSGLAGYINARGDMVIPVRFEEAAPFYEGRAAVRQGGRWGVIDLMGEWVVPPRFASPPRCSEGLLVGAVETEGVLSWTVVDASGKERFALPDGASPEGVFLDGLLRVRAPGRLDGEMRIGFLNREGNWAIRPVYAMAGDFREGLATVSRQMFRPVVVDATGRVVLGPGFTHIGEFSQGLAVASTREVHRGFLGYIDRKGEWVVAEKFADAGPFREGLARVMPAGFPRRYGFMDPAGEMVIPAALEIAGDMAHGRIRAFDDLRRAFGYLDARGRWVIPARFREAADFLGELAQVAWEPEDRLAGLVRGYIHLDGKVVWPPDAPPPRN